MHTILHIEDNIINKHLLRRYFRATDVTLIEAETGRQGINLAESSHPDLILLDVIMPGMDGIETCRRIKSLPAGKDIPIIFLTALSDPQSVVKGFEAGSVDYISKPIHPPGSAS